MKNLITPFTRTSLVVLSFLLLSPLAAQTANAPVDFMRSLGKMYVVVGVIVLVFLGLAACVWFLDRRLTNLEDQIDHYGNR